MKENPTSTCSAVPWRCHSFTWNAHLVTRGSHQPQQHIPHLRGLQGRRCTQTDAVFRSDILGSWYCEYSLEIHAIYLPVLLWQADRKATQTLIQLGHRCVILFNTLTSLCQRGWGLKAFCRRMPRKMLHPKQPASTHARKNDTTEAGSLAEHQEGCFWVHGAAVLFETSTPVHSALTTASLVREGQRPPVLEVSAQQSMHKDITQCTRTSERLYHRLYQLW